MAAGFAPLIKATTNEDYETKIFFPLVNVVNDNKTRCKVDAKLDQSVEFTLETQKILEIIILIFEHA